ncbi:hypothetical protein NC651_026977 [Populus alba x Populus x berolinensis]|nr:hypothetical protein NC651_026977 [Populus alba x Populus x berolinensis]
MACMKLGSKSDAFQRQGQACSKRPYHEARASAISEALAILAKFMTVCIKPPLLFLMITPKPAPSEQTAVSVLISRTSRVVHFQRFCTTGLPSDIVVEVEEMSFHLHKFPLLSRSGVMERLIAEVSEGDKKCVICLPKIPGGAKTFELVAKFCYGVKLELTASNVVYLRYASEQLEMI